MITMHDGKGEVFSLALKILTVLVLLMSNGNAFHSFGAAKVKEPVLYSQLSLWWRGHIRQICQISYQQC